MGGSDPNRPKTTMREKKEKRFGARQGKRDKGKSQTENKDRTH